MAKQVDGAIFYTAGRLAQKRANTQYSWYKLVWRWVPYIVSSGYLGLINLGLTQNQPKYTFFVVLTNLAALVWEIYTFVKNFSSRQDDIMRLEAAGYKLIGSGEDDAILYCPADVSKSQGISGKLPQA